MAGGELNIAYNGSLSTYSEADGMLLTQRDQLNHVPLMQPFVRFTHSLIAARQ